MKKHYVYRITNKVENKHYYGCRTTKLEPKDDLGSKYFSSSKDKSFIKDQKENPNNYKYKIIKIFSTREEAIELEIKLHKKFNVGLNDSFYNKVKQKSTGFDTTGILFIDGVKYTSEQYNANSSLKYHSFNKVTVKDTNGNILYVDKLNERYISGELIHFNCGRVQIKVYSVIKTIDMEEFKKGCYDMVFKNTVSVIDKSGNKYRVTKEEFDNNPDLYGQTKNKFVAIDKNGNKHHISNTDERYIYRENYKPKVKEESGLIRQE